MVVAGCGGGYQTLASNHSANAYVIRTDDDSDGTRFYSIRPGVDVVVDDTGEVNPPANTITLLAADCSEIQPISGRFWEGGQIVIASDGSVTFAPGRSVAGLPRFMAGPDEDTNSLPTCEAAAAAL